MGELKLSTKDSLYESIAVYLDGTKYECVKFTKQAMDQHLEFEENMGKLSEKKDSRGINKLVYEQVKKLFPTINGTALDQLHSRELFDIITLVENSVSAKKVMPKTEKEKQVKNAQTPGDKVSPT